ncbi:TauD/TfdA family dioxygenase [Pseudomonas sp. CC120222-01a]|uniref:TauD/TfdA family dioxygenase n=1 Tax=Pseudomonas sp. CC120222-01a TaxID=1378075 RepID=UPI000D9CD88F|nr:TauD/TfdA family dioxygenase [Pseudomonas sp. CC120222-01a]PVZ40550.1 TfdA family taurine catabolism dioxygenase TauD [Pseudomonas sp. CC120222-01a]
MESAHLHQGAELQASLEIRLPWVISSAWQTLLNNTPLDFETSKELYPQLKDQAQDVLGKALCQQIRGFVTDPYLTSMIVRNCPRDRDIPPTPYSGVLSPRSTPVACLVSLTMQSLMGINPVVYEGENDGRLFRHVIPSRHSSSHKSSHGSKLRFSYHVDNPDLPLSSEPLGDTSCCPEYLSFFGMRCDPRISTTLVSLDAVVAALPATTVRELCLPQFEIRRPDSFSGNRRCTAELPVLVRGQAGEWLCRFDSENTHGLNLRAEQALASLRSMLETRRFDEPHLLLPGDFMVFKNQRVLHARDGFEPQNDGADRWLLRLFAVNDLNRVHFARADHLYEVLS